MKPILIAKVGSTVAPLLERRGDFHDWIRVLLERSHEEVIVCEPHQGDVLPEVDSLGGVIITGASAMITDEEPWSVETEEWLARNLRHETPTLGICYGHQMLARVLGGRVDWSSSGREIGTVEVNLHENARRDSLFSVLPETLDVQTTHSQSVSQLPPGATLLASNSHEPFQAFSVGTAAWGVQFHPEFDADIIRGYLLARREPIEEEGIDVSERIESSRDSEHGRLLLQRFDAIVRERS